jgi:hypothetical protein
MNSESLALRSLGRGPLDVSRVLWFFNAWIGAQCLILFPALETLKLH